MAYYIMWLSTIFCGQWTHAHLHRYHHNRHLSRFGRVTTWKPRWCKWANYATGQCLSLRPHNHSNCIPLPYHIHVRWLKTFSCGGLLGDWTPSSVADKHMGAHSHHYHHKLLQLLCRTSQVARLLSSKNYLRRAHIVIYVGIQDILSSKSNTSSSINQSDHPAAKRTVKSTPSLSSKSVYT